MKTMNFLKNRKGAAMEMAIITLLIVFALCSMIVTLTMYSVKSGVDEHDEFYDGVLIDKIGEDFRSSVAWECTYDKESGQFIRYDDYVTFNPEEYREGYDTDDRELLITVRFAGNLSTLVLEENVTYHYSAITDDEGNTVAEESSREVTNHLLTVVVEKITDGDEVSYDLKQWSYVD